MNRIFDDDGLGRSYHLEWPWCHGQRKSEKRHTQKTSNKDATAFTFYESRGKFIASNIYSISQWWNLPFYTECNLFWLPSVLSSVNKRFDYRFECVYRLMCTISSISFTSGVYFGHWQFFCAFETFKMPFRITFNGVLSCWVYDESPNWNEQVWMFCSLNQTVTHLNMEHHTNSCIYSQYSKFTTSKFFVENQ